MALDQSRRGGVVVTQANQVAQHRISGSTLLELPQGLTFIALLRQCLASLISVNQDFGRHALLKELLEITATQPLQHLGLLGSRRPEMPLNKTRAQDPPSTLAL